MDFLSWFGRFHPALVHLPIGIMVVGAIFHWISLRKDGWKGSGAVSTIYFTGFVASVIAAFAGLMIAREGGYDYDTIFWHKWVGIAMAVFSLFLWRLSARDSLASPAIKWLSFLIIPGLLITGHLGGKMTHGETYLVENAPSFVKKLAGFKEGSPYAVFEDPDSTMVYEDLIQPVLEKKCWSCHSNALAKGKLNMEDAESFFEGGKNGSVIEGNAASSELYKRVVMDPERKKYMPPKGVPMSFGEIRLLEWWLDNGAPVEKSVSSIEGIPEEIQQILLDRHQLDTKPKSYIEKAKVDIVSEEVMQKIAEKGFSIRPIAMDNNFVDVKWKNQDSSSVNDVISILADASQQIAWLDLGASNLSDDALSTVGKLENLVRLKAQGNPITDAGIGHLTGLRHLESLNLYNTKITDACAPDLVPIKSLKKLFIWQTGFGDDGKSQLEAAIPDIEVVGGYDLDTVATETANE